MHISTLATDIDGTLIPTTKSTNHTQTLALIREKLSLNSSIKLLYITSRGFNEVLELIKIHNLPSPSTLICDGGATIYEHLNGTWLINSTYEAHLDEMREEHSLEKVRSILAETHYIPIVEKEHVENTHLRYTVKSTDMIEITAKVASLLQNLKLSINLTIDQSTLAGIVDITPQWATTISALLWLWQMGAIEKENVLYVGVKKDDIPIVEAGFHTIVVSNSDWELLQRIQSFTKEKMNKVYKSIHEGALGILEGWEYFGWD